MKNKLLKLNIFVFVLLFSGCSNIQSTQSQKLNIESSSQTTCLSNNTNKDIVTTNLVIPNETSISSEEKTATTQETSSKNSQEKPKLKDNEIKEITIDETELSTETDEIVSEEIKEIESGYTYIPLNQTMYATAELNVRSGPSVDFEILGYLKFTQEVQVIGKCNETGWYQVDIGLDVPCFVSNKYLTEEKIEPAVNICKIDGNVDVSFQNKVNKELEKIPEKFLNAFVSHGWTMYVTDKNIDQYFCAGRFGSVKGLTSYSDKKIYVEDRDNAITSIPHEMGHFFDCDLGFVSSTQDYMDIFYAEQDAFKTTFNVNFYWDNKELFAEGFAMYFEQPKTLAGACPRLYALLNEKISSY